MIKNILRYSVGVLMASIMSVSFWAHANTCQDNMLPSECQNGNPDLGVNPAWNYAHGGRLICGEIAEDTEYQECIWNIAETLQYKQSMMETARQIIANGQEALFPQFAEWYALANK